MSMEGDALDGQPAEGALTLDGLAQGMNDSAQDDLPEGEEGEESEEVEEEDGEEEEADESEEDDDEDDEDTDPTVKIKHDGKEIEVKLSEALNLAQQGYDYTNKTMKVAEDRKAIDAERSQVKERYQQVEQTNQEALNRLQSFTQYMETQVGQPPSADMLSTHGADHYLALKEQYEARRGTLQQAYAAQQQIQQDQHRQRQAAISEKAEATEAVLRDTLPGWDDKTLDTLSGYISTLGLNPQTASDALLEPGLWQLAHKAQAYDALQDQKSKLKPVHKLSKASKPQATNNPSKVARKQEASKRYAKNPSLQTLADLL